MDPGRDSIQASHSCQVFFVLLNPHIGTTTDSEHKHSQKGKPIITQNKCLDSSPYNRLYTLGTHKTPLVLLNTIIKMHFMLFPSLIKTAFFYFFFFVKGFGPSLCIMQTANLTEVKCIDSEEWHLIFTSVNTKGGSTDLLNQPVNDELKSHRLGKGALCRQI